MLKWRWFVCFCLLAGGCERTAPLPDDVPSNTPRLRELDFTPFADALDRVGSRRLAEVDALVRGGDIAEVRQALDAGRVSSEELTLYFLDRIRRHDGALRSYLELNPEALDEARAADRFRAGGGGAVRPMLGIPVSVKDNIATAPPMHTTAGAEILLDHMADRDAAVVVRLREAGAVILGKASLSELAGLLTSEPPGANAVGGRGINPYRADLPVSGSSSGSAVAVSAYLAMASIGTETSGSLISPGSSNGVVAMKPSRGVVSPDGILPLVRFQDSAGPVVRTVRDAAILLSAIDEGGTDYAAALDADALAGVAVGVLRDPGDAELWHDRIIEGLAKAGARPLEIGDRLGGGPALMPVVFLGLSRDTVPALVAAGAPVRTLADLQAYNLADPARRIPLGQNLVDEAVRFLDAVVADTGIPEEELGPLYESAALSARERAGEVLSVAFEENGVGLLASLGNSHSVLYATAGYPAITVPLGLEVWGAPEGVTLIARPGEDAKLLGYAYAFEQATRYRVEPGP